jgi:ornithine carbamoyltransferase
MRMSTTRCENFKPLATGDLLTVAELSRDEIESLLATAAMLKQPGGYCACSRAFAGRSLVMLFEKPSLRTRMTFEIGFAKLGGHPVYVDQQSAGGRIGQRESIADVARNLERWCDGIVARTFAHETVEQLAQHARVPVVNALSDRFHPCQALADVLTIAEKFPHRSFNEISCGYVGDGNNVCASLMLAGAVLGMNMTVVTPKGYEPAADVVAQAQRIAAGNRSTIEIGHDRAALAGHDVIYTDTWVSMGSESEAEQRVQVFAPYQVTPAMMAAASENAIFMHCLPAYRGKEVAAGVMDGPQSVVFDQAENRMHAQNALLLHLLANDEAEHHVPAWPDAIGAS